MEQNTARPARRPARYRPRHKADTATFSTRPGCYLRTVGTGACRLLTAVALLALAVCAVVIALGCGVAFTFATDLVLTDRQVIEKHCYELFAYLCYTRLLRRAWRYLKECWRDLKTCWQQVRAL